VEVGSEDGSLVIRSSAVGSNEFVISAVGSEVGSEVSNIVVGSMVGFSIPSYVGFKQS